MCVVVPFYRGERFLPGLVETLAQSDPDQIVVVVDGGEQREAVDEAFRGLLSCTVVATDQAMGTAAARNFGARFAKQTYITFLDQDDSWPPQFLADLLEHMSGEALAYDNIRLAELDGDSTVVMPHSVFETARFTDHVVGPDTASRLLRGFPMVKLVLTREVFARVGGFREDLYAIEDFDLVVGVVAASIPIQVVHEPRGLYLEHAHSTTATVRADPAAYIRGQRSWRRVWVRVASSSSLPMEVRTAAARLAMVAAAKVVAHGLRERVRAIRRLS